MRPGECARTCVSDPLAVLLSCVLPHLIRELTGHVVFLESDQGQGLERGIGPGSGREPAPGTSTTIRHTFARRSLPQITITVPEISVTKWRSTLHPVRPATVLHDHGFVFSLSHCLFEFQSLTVPVQTNGRFYKFTISLPRPNIKYYL